MTAKPETINSPSHYVANGFEAIKVIEAFDLNFSLGSAVKYLLRAGRKTPDKLEDIRKAKRCLEMEIARLEAKP